MKKTFVSVFLCAFCLISGFSFDYGAVISDKIKTNGQAESGSLKDGFQNDSTATAWLRFPLAKDGRSYFVTEGYYNSNWKNLTDKTNNVLDVSLCEVTLKTPSSSKIKGTLNLGRFALYDATCMIFAQAADGAMVTVESGWGTFTAYGGYTGLLNAKSTLYNTASTAGIDKDDVYVLDDPYAVAETSLLLPNLVGSQSLSAEFLSAWDMDNGYDRMYVTGSLNGPVANSVFYILSSTLELSRSDRSSDWKPANLSKASLTMYPGKVFSSLGLNGIFASGDKDALNPFSVFTPGTSTIAGHIWSDVVKAGAFVTVKPVENFLISGSGDAIFVASDNFSYNGFEWKCSLLWQVVSDFQLSGSASQFIPDSGDSTVELTLKTSLAL